MIMASDDLFDAISHPLRIEILKTLAKGPMRFADIKRKFKIESSGQLDFHLKKMEILLTTNAMGEYELNDRGFSALRAVNIVSHHGWQRRSWFANVIMYLFLSSIFLLWSIPLWWLPFIPYTGWIVFYTYWTFVKRKVRLRENGSSIEDA